MVLNQVEMGKMTETEAIEVLDLSSRDAREPLAADRKESGRALADGNRGRKPTFVSSCYFRRLADLLRLSVRYKNGELSVAKRDVSIDDLGVSTIQLTNEEKVPTIRRTVGKQIIMSEKKVRVLLAKGGLDAHDTGVKVVASALRDAGMEVIYIGLRQSPENVVQTAIQEDVDIIGISSLSGSLIPMARRLMGLVKEKNLNIPVIYGGTILKSDREELLNMGVKETFAPGASFESIVEKVKKLAGEGAAS